MAEAGTARFSGKVALVTGAAGGIGSALVRMLRAEGARVAAADRDVGGVEADARLPGDLTDPGYCDALPETARTALGGLDMLFNNAGLMRRGDVTETGDEDLRLLLAVNVEAPFRLARAAVPIVARASRGAIVNTASCWGMRPGPGHAAYCMTKQALASLTQCMGRDHAHQGVRVNAVCPNEVDTPMLRTGFERRGLDPATAIADLGRTVPLGHVASPEEVAEVALFLALDAARYVCGCWSRSAAARPCREVRG